jgi:hypothetical protein
MDADVQLISDGDGLAVIGNQTAVISRWGARAQGPDGQQPTTSSSFCFPERTGS